MIVEVDWSKHLDHSLCIVSIHRGTAEAIDIRGLGSFVQRAGGADGGRCCIIYQESMVLIPFAAYY